ncbi:hypothetical protein QQZ08_001383 [Neonectria magnoliae]|uniref:Uncharacterized protein n=1 Tax=Neonectria magnoliae TaxID=2732573 RepID=A0ABR1IGW3_9HYPO
MVFAFNEVLTHNEIYDLMERLGGEKLERKYVPAEAIQASIAEIETPKPAPDSLEFITLASYQYWYSCGVRGNNTSENAQYLGYLLAKDLYPDLEVISLATYTQQVIDGKRRRAYEHLKDLPAARAESATKA